MKKYLLIGLLFCIGCASTSHSGNDYCSKNFIKQKNQSKKSVLFSENKLLQTKFQRFYRNGSRQLYISFKRTDRDYVVIQQDKTETMSFKRAFVLGGAIRIGIIFDNKESYILSFKGSENIKTDPGVIQINNSSNFAEIDSAFNRLLRSHHIVDIEIQNPFNDFNETKIRSEDVNENDSKQIQDVYNCFMQNTTTR